jgi:hypothetical protein
MRPSCFFLAVLHRSDPEGVIFHSPGRSPGFTSGLRWPSAAYPCFQKAGVGIALLLALTACGCKETALSGQTQPAVEAAPSTDSDDVPITAADVPVHADFAEAIERLESYRDAIRQAVESGHLGKAHRPLDETNIAVDRLPDVARSSGVPRRLWEEVVTAGEDLQEALDEIHTAIDAGRTPDYHAHAAVIDEALARLKAVAEMNRKRNLPEETNP